MRAGSKLTELESSRSSSTTGEWDLVGQEVRSTSRVANSDTDSVVI